MPEPVTARGPKRSASMPAPAPKTKYTPPDRPNTSATSARRASNSAANDAKNAANEYDTPKMMASATKVAQTTTHAYGASFIEPV